MINEAIIVINFVKKRPMFVLAVLISILTVIGYYSFWISLILAALCIIFLFMTNYKKQSGVLILCGALLLLSMLSTSYYMGELERAEDLDGKAFTGEFLAVEASEHNGVNYACVIEVIESDRLKRGDKLMGVYSGAEIPLGQSFRAQVVLSAMDENVIAESFYAEGVYLFADLSNLVLTDNSDGVLTALRGFRGYIKSEIYKYLQNDEAAVTFALLTGDRTEISEELYSNLKGAGVMHAMVVSGMHLAIIVSFMLWAVNRFLYNRFLKGTIILLTVLAVAAVCGFTMSILRAGITYVLYAIALFIGREPRADNCLGTAVCIILLTNPFAVFSAAFLLSVLSTFGVLCVALPIIKFTEENVTIKLKWLTLILSPVIISLAALLMTLPVMISTFGYVSNMSIISNLLVSFPITVVIWLCLIGFILFPLKVIMLWLAGWILKYIISVVNLLGAPEFAVTYLPDFAVYISIFIIILVLFAMFTCENRKIMLKLKGILNKKAKEGGGKLKWRSFTKKR